jgi:hypothetical protein
MASALRQMRGGKVSFFLFMDTITAVTAMLIMVSLMMTLYVTDSPVAAPGGGEAVRARTRAMQAESDQITVRNQRARELVELARTAPDTNRLAADIAMLRVEVASASSNVARVMDRVFQQDAAARQRATQLGLGEERVQLDLTRRQVDALRQTNQLARAELDDLKQKVRDLEAQIERTKRDRSKLWLIPEADGSGKMPLLVSLSATNLVWERFNQPATRKQFPTSAAEQPFSRLLAELRPDRDYLVFYIRPSGISQFERYSLLAKNAGFNLGYDAVEENTQILFSPPQEP